MLSCATRCDPFTSIDEVQPRRLYFFGSTVSSGISMHTINRRLVAMLLVGVLNAAWFFAVGCASVCALGSCPQQLNTSQADRCHHGSDAPSHRHDEHQEAQCPSQSLLLAGGLTPSGPDVVPGLQATASIVFSPSCVPNLVRTGQLSATRSHSPPGDLSGRSICQKESLLRI